MTLIKDITDAMEQWAPLNYQESYDNAGLIVGNPQLKVTGVLITLDSTEDVVDEAIKKGANLIIAHHPIVFSGLKRFNGSNYIERTIIKAIKNDIAIYACHTNLDAVMTGVNSKICDLLDLENRTILNPRNFEDEVGSGMVGYLKTEMNELDFLKLIKKQFKAGCVRYTKLLDKKVKKIAVCGGSGSFLLSNAIGADADVFLTSDFKYHQFFDAEEKLVIADIGHFEAEICTQQLIYDYLKNKFTTFATHFSAVNTNPINYL
ncbi:MAG: Nif3-like dinuclear metal center hexameric protein [Flavobacteriales bacterium]|jgi:dinuclear metal center YbgI/SA1388 family protein|nr:Nif3-like dinuclear metal center hexameric protein [Flavobacteriales bacterium]